MFSKLISNDIIKFSPMGGHSYCISRRGMKHVLDNYKSYIGRIHYDHFLVKSKLNCFCTIPMLFDQNSYCTSDNTPYDNIEVLMRLFSCPAEDYSIAYRPTVFKYNLHMYRHQCISGFIVSLLVLSSLIFVVVIKSSCK